MKVFCLFTLLIMAVTLSGCDKNEIGGMRIEQAFTQPQVVSFIEAVIDENFDEADLWLAKGVDINTVGSQGITPVFWVNSVIGNDNLEIFEYLLKRGINPNYLDEKRQVSMMWSASGGDNPELLKLVIKYGGDVNQIADKESMLMVAANQGRMENIKLLLKAGADMSWSSEWGESAASIALNSGRFDITRFFLEQGYNTNLEKLAAFCEGSLVNEKMQLEKERVIDMLKDAGVKFPAGPRRKSYIENHQLSEKQKWDLIYGRYLPDDF